MSIAVPQDIWRAVAGPSVKIPAVNSYVYYFPQGHLENSSSNVEYNYNGDSTSIPCRVISLRFLSTSSTDEYFVKIQLQPVAVAEIHAVNENEDENDNDNNDQTDISYFAKVLTPSDASLGISGFVAPRSGADSIFPKLDLSVLNDLAQQRLSCRDMTHDDDNPWEFRHVYYGNPPRHFLNNGWSKFVNSKRLAAEDYVVFMKRKSTEQMFVGIRRKQGTGSDERIRTALVAIRRAAGGMMFEVDYYPRKRFSDFVVSAARVQRSMSTQWRAGMRVRIHVPRENTGRIRWYWYRGKIQSVVNSQNNNNSVQWRMLQVNWNGTPQVLKELSRVSPWEVDCVLKRLRESMPPHKSVLESLPRDHGEFSSPLMGSSLLNAAPMFNNPPSSLTVERDDSHHQLFPERPGRRVGKEPETVYPALNTIGSSNKEHSSTNVKQGQNSSTGGGASRVMLFGADIGTPEKPIEGGGSRNGESDVRTEEVQPNSSPDRVG